MANIVTTQTKEQLVASQIDSLITQAFNVQKGAYTQVRRLVYNNSAFKNPDGTFNADAVFTSFAANTKLGMSASDLGNFARVSKACINFAQPNTISDDVPPATISLP